MTGLDFGEQYLAVEGLILTLLANQREDAPSLLAMPLTRSGLEALARELEVRMWPGLRPVIDARRIVLRDRILELLGASDTIANRANELDPAMFVAEP